MELALTMFGKVPSGVYFNVQAHVGQNKFNLFEDVMLVQYLFKKLAEAGVPPGNAELRTEMAAVKVTGAFDDATRDAILAFQKDRGYTPDGVVSPAKNGGGYGSGMYTIWLMNAFVRDSFPKVWPRLQDFADCPPTIKANVQVSL